MKETGANIGSKLSVLKSIALGSKSGKTFPCNELLKFMCCRLIGSVLEVNGVPVPCAPGNCKTKNVIYLVTCKICAKPYFGRTVQMVGKRMGGHRECFYKVLEGGDVDLSSDDYSLGLHLLSDHGATDRTDFNNSFQVQIVEICSPASLEKKEHLYIHKYKTLYPIGLNKINPFGLSVLSL